jgi:protein-arginine kinase
MEHTSLQKKHTTPEIKEELKDVVTPSGFRLEDVIRSGEENPDSSVGVYAGDEESYTAFASLFNPIIEEYHHHSLKDGHKRDLNVAHLGDVTDLDPSGESIVSTRVRIGRNLKGFPFAPAISREQRLEVERRVVEALSTLTGDLAGTYYPLSGMSEEVRAQLVQDHFLFKQGDRFLESAGANRDWPEGRGIFHSPDKKALVWVNEEDHLRIISMQKGGNIREVFDRLSRLVTAIEEKLPFAYSDTLGYLSSCPTNLGTVMRASVHVKLPRSIKLPEFKKECADMGLSVRGNDGEHSESKGGIVDISNKRRLGISEVEGVLAVASGVSSLMEDEKELADAELQVQV